MGNALNHETGMPCFPKSEKTMTVQPTMQKQRTMAQSNAGQGGFQLVDQTRPGQNGSYEAFSSKGQYAKGPQTSTPSSRVSLQAASPQPQLAPRSLYSNAPSHQQFRQSQDMAQLASVQHHSNNAPPRRLSSTPMAPNLNIMIPSITSAEYPTPVSSAHFVPPSGVLSNRASVPMNAQQIQEAMVYGQQQPQAHPPQQHWQPLYHDGYQMQPQPQPLHGPAGYTAYAQQYTGHAQPLQVSMGHPGLAITSRPLAVAAPGQLSQPLSRSYGLRCYPKSTSS